MEVKVSKVKNIQPAPKSYLEFEWKCTKCGATVMSEVVENVLLQYKTRTLGPMTVKKTCGGCKTLHSMELRL